MINDPVLEVQNIAIGYGAKKIGQNISFTVYNGETLCLLGPNGSGKSTLFKSVLGLIPLLAGQVQLQGQAMAQYSRRQIAQKIAYVPQATAGSFAFKVLEMVTMGRSAHIALFAAPSRTDQDIAIQCLEQLGIAHLASRIYTELSGGEQQLVLLARALAQQPKLLVLDEPTASLDFGNQIRVLDQIRVLRNQGLAIFLCTHQPEHAHRIADKVLLFKKGQLMAAGSTVDTLSVLALSQLYELPVASVHQHLQNLIR